MLPKRFNPVNMYVLYVLNVRYLIKDVYRASLIREVNKRLLKRPFQPFLVGY
jgi:hypothetical protein